MSDQRIVARAPVRIDVAGGGTDAPPYCVEYGGAVINISVAKYATASFQRLPAGSGANIYSHDFESGVHAVSSDAFDLEPPVAFLKAFARRLLPGETDYLLETKSEVMTQTGLGGSGAIGIAVAAALTEARGEPLSRQDLTILANEVERIDFGSAGGNQDSYGAAFGGFKLITYHQGGGSECEVLEVPEATRQEIESRTLLIYTGGVHLSGSIHADIKRAYNLEHSPVIQAMDNLKDAAIRMAAGLREGDLEVYADCLNQSRINHYALHESCDSDSLRNYFRELDAFLLAGKTCGAGGGGFIAVFTKPGQTDACRVRAEELGGLVWPLHVDAEGVQTRREPTADTEDVRYKCKP